jgi:hypothetical protein
VAVGNFVQVGVGTFRQHQSSVAMDGAGNYTVAYTRDTNNNNPDVFAKRYDTNGVLQSVLTVAGSAYAESNPSVAMDPAADYLAIAYQAQQGNRTVVYVNEYTSRGIIRRIDRVTTGQVSDYQPSVAVDWSGDVAVAYDEEYSNGMDYIDATRIDYVTGAQSKMPIDYFGVSYSLAVAPTVTYQPNGVYYAVAYTRTPGFASYVAVVGPSNGSYTITSRYGLGFSGFASISSLSSGTFLAAGVTTVSTIKGNIFENHVLGELGTYH